MKEKKRRAKSKGKHEETSRELLRYAFIINLPGADPRTCSAVYQNKECYCMVAGAGGAEMGKSFVRELLDQGYAAIDLCSDFSAEIVSQIREMAKMADEADKEAAMDTADMVDEEDIASKECVARVADKASEKGKKPEDDKTPEEIKAVRIGHAKYTLDGLIKLDFTRTFRKCGIIIAAGGVKQIVEMLLKNDKRDVHIAFAGNIRQAKSAAQRMIEKQVDYIELSYWFDRMRLDSVVRAIDGRVAVGTCGDLTMQDLVDYPSDEPARVTVNAKKR